MSIVRRGPRSGNAAMEFAFWLPILMLLIGGIVDLAWFMSRHQNVVRAARDGARLGATVLEDQDVVKGSQIEAAAEEQADLVLLGLGMDCENIPGCTISALYDNTTGRAAVVVTVHVPFEPLVGIAPVPTELAAQFAMMAQQQW